MVNSTATSATPARVVVVSNDVTPGMGVPTAAPGLRAYGLAAGLRAHGYEVDLVVDRGPQNRVWGDDVPAPGQEGAVSLPPAQFMDYVSSRAPVTVVTTNSNQVGALRRADGVKYVIDFFAPKMLEHAHQHGDDHPAEMMAELRERKLQAIELGDGFIVNGAKKVPYFLAWLLQGSRDIRTLPLEVVNMAMPNHFVPAPRHEVVKFGMAGYLQGWSKPAAWVRSVLDLVDQGRATFEVLAPSHWGQSDSNLRSDALQEVFDHPGVTARSAMLLSDYQVFIAGLDVVLDVFDHSLEREYAMVTRTVSALACGRPVVHPDFTEVSPFIREFGAGWIVESGAPSEVERILNSIIEDRGEIDTRAEHAREAWRRTFEPRVATAPLAKLIDGLWT